MSKFKNIIVGIETEEEASKMIDFLQKQGFKKLQEYHRKHRYIATNEEGFFFYRDFENDYNYDPEWTIFYSFKEFNEYLN